MLMNQIHKKTNTTWRRMTEWETAGTVWPTSSSVNTKVQIPINDGNLSAFRLWVMPYCLSSPLRAVAHLHRELWLTSQEMSPATSINLSPLRALPCGATAWAAGLSGQPQQGLEIIIVIPISFFFFFKGGGIQHSAAVPIESNARWN